MLVLKEARNLATRSLASFLAALMSSTDCAKRLFWRSLAALRAALMRDEACERAASASARSLAMVERTSRNFLAMAIAWAASLERPFLASSSMLAILLSKAFM